MKFLALLCTLAICQFSSAQVIYNNIDLKQPSHSPFISEEEISSVRTYFFSGQRLLEEDDIALSDSVLIEETYYGENGKIDVSFNYPVGNPRNYLETSYSHFGDTIRVEEKNRTGDVLYHWKYVDSLMVDAAKYDEGPLYTWSFSYNEGVLMMLAAFTRGGVEIYREETERDALNRAIYECRFDAGKLSRIKFFEYDLSQNAILEYTFDHTDISRASKKLKKEPEELCGLGFEEVSRVLKKKVNTYSKYPGSDGLKKEVEYDRFNEMTYITEYKYDQAGNLSAKIYKVRIGKIEYDFGEVSYTYDETGNLQVKDEFTFKDGRKYLKRYRYEYTLK